MLSRIRGFQNHLKLSDIERDKEVCREHQRYYERYDGDIEFGFFRLFHGGEHPTYGELDERYYRVHHHAHAYTVRYAVAERHDDYRKERGHRVAHGIEVHVFDVAHHEHAHVYERACRRRTGYESEERQQEYGEQEERRGSQRRKTRSAARSHAGTRFDERRDRRRTEQRARAGRDGIRVHALVEVERLAVFIQQSRARGAAGDRTEGIEHVDHTERYDRHYAVQHRFLRKVYICERRKERTALRRVHREEVCEILPEFPGNASVAREHVYIGDSRENIQGE